MSTLSDRLAAHALRARHLRPGQTQKLICPACDGGSDREPSLSLTVDQDGDGATWICHRGSCGWKGGERLGDRGEGRPALPSPSPYKRYTRPEPIAKDAVDRPQWLFEAFEKRGISRPTIDHFGVYACRRSFPQIGEADALVFPYRRGGLLVNRKFRPHPQKHPMMQERDAEPTLYNVDAIVGAETVVWVEGEMDVMALHEAGFPSVVSLKDGAPAELRKESDPRRADDKRFAALDTDAGVLGKVSKFILAGDEDGPGRVLREELARRLGRHRCWTVEWPNGCKDAGEVLQRFGADAIAEALIYAQPWPIEGLQTINVGTLLDYRNAPRAPTLTTGTAASDAILRLPRRRSPDRGDRRARIGQVVLDKVCDGEGHGAARPSLHRVLARNDTLDGFCRRLRVNPEAKTVLGQREGWRNVRRRNCRRRGVPQFQAFLPDDGYD